MKRQAAAAIVVVLATSPLFADSNPVEQQRHEIAFRQHIQKYLQAETCARLYGGHEVTKDRLLAAAKEIARNLPEDRVETIWRGMREENFTHPPLPPNEQVCADLRTRVTR